MMTPARRFSSPPRRGFTLTEMLIAIGLVAVVGSLATQIAGGVLTLGRDLATGEREELAVGRAAATMRRDVERATDVAVIGDDISLGESAGGTAVTWTHQDDGLLRSAGDRRDYFGPLPAAASMSVAGRVVRLRIGDAAWTWRPLIEPNGGRQ